MSRFAALTKRVLLVSALVASTAVAAQANPDQKNPVSAQELTEIYAGKTWVWSVGGSYWGKDSSFQAIAGEAVGLGKWYATNKGDLCYEATWYKGGSGEGKQLKRCFRHVKDSQGVMWKQDPKNKTWYKPNKEFSERLKSGNKIKRDVKKARKKNGV